MPELRENEIPINDSYFAGRAGSSESEYSGGDRMPTRHLGADKPEGHRVDNGSQRPGRGSGFSLRGALFLLFWVLVAAGILVCRQLPAFNGQGESKPKAGAERTASASRSQRDSLPTRTANKKSDDSSVNEKAPKLHTYPNDSSRAEARAYSRVVIPEKVPSSRRAQKDHLGQDNKGRISRARKNLESLRLQARDAATKGHWVSASRLASAIVQRAPRSLEDRRFLGLCLVRAASYQRAIRELEKVSREGAPDAVVEHYLGHAFYKMGFYGKALGVFRKAMIYEPENPRHYKCGARLIVEIQQREPSYLKYLSLAEKWYYKALRLGVPAGELRRIKVALKNHRRYAFSNNR